MTIPKEGDLRVWWIPQVPMEAFHVPVADAEEAARVLEMLAAYDAFQFEKGIKPDYCNTGGLEIYELNSDGDGNPGWSEWESEDGEDIRDASFMQDLSGFWQWREGV